MSAVFLRRYLDRLRSRSSDRRDRGAVMIEFLLAVPIVILFLFAVIEFSLLWRNSLTVSTATQLGARAAANAGPHRLADHNALSSALAGLSELPDDSTIERIVVFSPINDAGDIDPDCLTGPSKAGRCNVYEGALLNNPLPADFTAAADPATQTTCEPGSPDEAWCPGGRENDFSNGFDQVGVYVQVRHRFVTGLVLPSREQIMRDEAVMQLEPEVN